MLFIDGHALSIYEYSHMCPSELNRVLESGNKLWVEGVDIAGSRLAMFLDLPEHMVGHALRDVVAINYGYVDKCFSVLTGLDKLYRIAITESEDLDTPAEEKHLAYWGNLEVEE